MQNLCGSLSFLFSNEHGIYVSGTCHIAVHVGILGQSVLMDVLNMGEAVGGTVGGAGFSGFAGLSTPARAVALAEVDRAHRPQGLVDGLVRVWERSVVRLMVFLPTRRCCVSNSMCRRRCMVWSVWWLPKTRWASPWHSWERRRACSRCCSSRTKRKAKVWAGRLLRWGIERYGVERLTVNEQNPQARRFYEHMGFVAYKRTATDGQGNPYPLIYMKLA